MNRQAIILGMTALIAGCGKPSVDERNASVADVAKAVAGSDLKFAPGRWESKVRFLDMKAPGMPPEAAAAVAKMAGKDHLLSTCLSKASADKPGADFFAKDKGSCRYEHFTLGGGKLDARMQCGKDAGEAEVRMTGSYGPTHYAMTMETVAQGPGNQPMTMRMAVDANHVGQCTGKEDGRS